MKISPLSTKTHFTILDVAKDSVRPCLNKKGLPPNFVTLDSMEEFLWEKDDDILNMGLKLLQLHLQLVKKIRGKKMISGNIQSTQEMRGFFSFSAKNLNDDS